MDEPCGEVGQHGRALRLRVPVVLPMSTVRRVAPEEASAQEQTDHYYLGFLSICGRAFSYPDTLRWNAQCLQDLAAGRHAVGCGCDETDSRWTPNGWDTSEERYMQNACSEIVRCALEMRDYECEVGDASD